MDLYDRDMHEHAQATMLSGIDMDGLVRALHNHSVEDYNRGGSGEVDVHWSIPKDYAPHFKDVPKKRIAEAFKEQLKLRIGDACWLYVCPINLQKPSRFGAGCVKVTYRPDTSRIRELSLARRRGTIGSGPGALTRG